MDARRSPSVLLLVHLVHMAGCGGLDPDHGSSGRTGSDRPPSGTLGGGETPADPGTGRVEDENVPPRPTEGDLGAALALVHGLGGGILSDAETLLERAIDAARIASEEAGRPTLTGRLSQRAPGSSEVIYAPSDDEHLTLDVFAEDGAPLRIVLRFDRAQGQGRFPAEILGADHDLAVYAFINGVWDATVESRRAGAEIAIVVSGAVTRDGRALEVALRFSGTRRGEVDSTGSSSQVSLTGTGAIRGPDLDVEVSETFEAEVVTAGGDSATASTSRVAHVARLFGRTYRYEDVVVRRNFRDGVPSDVDGFWRADGRVQEGGATVATYALDAEVVDRRQGTGFVVVWLRLPTGDVELERWLKSR